jgi:hypothetical protein
MQITRTEGRHDHRESGGKIRRKMCAPIKDTRPGAWLDISRSSQFARVCMQVHALQRQRDRQAQRIKPYLGEQSTRNVHEEGGVGHRGSRHGERGKRILEVMNS